MSHVQYWPVGATACQALPLSSDQISTHVLADWLPAIPSTMGTALIGWPSFILETFELDGREYLSLHERAGQSERQWKGFVSWMLGVACARHVLATDNYRWIAPLSAFYPTTSAAVAIPDWHFAYPQTRIVVDQDPSNPSRLRPDYLAVRSTAHDSIEWAVVESKGVSRCLASLSAARADWRAQARNATLSIDNVATPIPRHIVIATRVNPNAKRQPTRRLQVRAWNKRERLTDDEASAMRRRHEGLVVETVSASLFGLYRNLGLSRIAQALALSAEMRRTSERSGAKALQNNAVQPAAEAELAELESLTGTVDVSPATLDLGTFTIATQFAKPTLQLTRKLVRGGTSQDLFKAVKECDEHLDKWQRSPSTVDLREHRVRHPVGIEFTIESHFVKSPLES